MLAQVGRWIYQYRYAVVVAWAVALAAMLPVAPQAQSKLLPGGFTSENFSSQKARDLLQERFGVKPDRDTLYRQPSGVGSLFARIR